MERAREGGGGVCVWGGGASRKWGSENFPRENVMFRKAVDAFLLHLECNFGL